MSTLLRGARVVGGAPDPVEVLVEGGLIVAVGPDASAHPSAAGADPVDLDGRWLIPGLSDNHTHLGQWAASRRRVDVSAATSAAHAATIITDAARADPPEPGTVLVGWGFRDGLWPDAPSAELLEADGIPISLVSGDVHTNWLNDAAVRHFGLPRMSWWLREQPAFDLLVRLADVPDATLDAWVDDAVRAATARGVVGVTDLEMTDAGASWQRRRGSGVTALRVRAAVYPEHLDAAVARGQRTGEPLDGTDGLVVGGPLKIFADGSLNTRTALTEDPYPGSHDDNGLASHEPAGLIELARLAVANGMLPTIHAIGDEAVTRALDAFQAVGTRGSIEHAQLVRDADLPRFAALGVELSVQPEHAMDDRDVADRYWAGRTGRMMALRSLLDAGATLRFGSDAPVAPLDPWITMAAAVTRSRDGREPWHPEQSISAAEALAASVRSNIAAGQPADLVVLDADPLAVAGEDLRAMPVAATMIAGRWVHGA